MDEHFLTRLWTPQRVAPNANELVLLGGVSSDVWLYLLVQGPPPPPPPRSKEEDALRHVPMRVLKVYTESEEELRFDYGGGEMWKYHVPHAYTQPLVVRLHDEDGSVIWETVITAITPE